MKRVATASVLLILLLSAGRALAVDDNLPGGTAISIDVTAPATGALIPADQPVITIQGAVAVGEGAAVADTLLVYVLDVSGSVSEAGQGCGGDINADGVADTVLDCEIAAALALNADAMAAGSVGEVGVVAFSSGATTGDVSPEAGVQLLTMPAADRDGVGGPDVGETLKSAIARFNPFTFGLQRFTPRSTGNIFTNYHAGVSRALELVNASAMPNKLVIFMSDGQNTQGSAVTELRSAVEAGGALFHTFAVGSNTGFSCTTNSFSLGSLLDVAQLSEPDGSCTPVAAVADLPNIVPDVINGELTGLSLSVNDGPYEDVSAAAGLVVPQIGPVMASFALDIPNLPIGENSICLAAYGRDGGGRGSAEQCILVTVTDTPATTAVTNLCDAGAGSLRAAIARANENDVESTIQFELTDPQCGSDGVIRLTSPLPQLTSSMIIDGRPGETGALQPIIDGSAAGEGANGFVISAAAAGSILRGLTVQNFAGSAIVIGAPESPSNGNLIADNVLAFSGDDGITILAGINNRLLNNNIYSYRDQAIDLGGDGPTPNDQNDLDAGANFMQNYPVLFRAAPTGANTLFIEGWLNSLPEKAYTIQLFAAPSCGDGSQARLSTEAGAGDATILTDANGEAYFQLTVDEPVAPGWAIQATTTDSEGNTSEMSACILVSIDNDAWPRALGLAPGSGAEPPVIDRTDDPANDRQTWTVRQYLDQAGQSRWYRFPVQPDSNIVVTLSRLPADYDLTLYRDIAAVYADLTAPVDEEDLHRLGAEFAPSAFSPSAFSPSAFSPSAFSPSAFSPSAFSPSAFSPSAFSPSAFSPSAFSPSAFSPSAFSPSAFSPSAFSPTDFSNAQMRSLVAVSATDGDANEQLRASTWTNTGDFYVRVRGREGAFSQAAPFELNIAVQSTGCDTTLFDNLPATSMSGVAGDYRSLIVTDLARMSGDTIAMQQSLATLAARPEVRGAVVDLGGDARVAAANALADGPELRNCPYAKNVVADSTKVIIDSYRAANPNLQYIVLVGGDAVIPFYRYPDNALLGNESNFFPPVIDDTASQASLRRGYVLSQDGYGARLTLTRNATDFPIPDLAVGRLVETPTDIVTQLSAYLGTPNGVVPAPASALVTGYDFLEDAALAVRSELQAGIGPNAVIDSLITPADQSPLAPTIAQGGQVWTAQDLGDLLRDNRYDLAFLAGHFNANSALAADFSTSLVSTQVRDQAFDLTNSIIFSVGCHSGYNIVNEHGIPGVTFEPDWTQVFAQRGATLIAGTGYQYGDTEFLEYSERLYLEFTRELRAGTGPVAVGDALTRAKQRYLETTPSLRGLHEKSLLEATLFGLPMLSVDMPGERIQRPPDAGVVSALTPVDNGPGAVLNLQQAVLTISPVFAPQSTELTNVEPNAQNSAPTVLAQWLAGGDGVVTNAAEPALPLEVRNVTAPTAGFALRGVGLRSAGYTDIPNILPLTGAPTTEIRGVHSPFFSDVFYPLRVWGVNYFGELTRNGGGTRLIVTPAQHRSSSPGSQTSTLRRFDNVELALYYSGTVSDFTSARQAPAAANASRSAGGEPGAAAPPTIVSVQSAIATNAGDSVITFQVRAVGNPAAGIQTVWITYTGESGSPFYGAWQSLDLAQDGVDSTLWSGQLNLGSADPALLRFIAQAANGVGLVTAADNLGRYYQAGSSAFTASTSLTLEPYAASGPFGGTAVLTATLRDANGAPLANQTVNFALGVQSAVARTDGSGVAQVEIPLLSRPGAYDVRATFAGGDGFAGAAADGGTRFTVTQQATALCLDMDLDNDCDADDIVTGQIAGGPIWAAAILTDAGAPPRRQIEQSVFFEVTGPNGGFTIPATTDFTGRARLNVTVPMAAGGYQITARYPGTPALTPSSSPAYALSVPAENLALNCGEAYVDPASIWPVTDALVPVAIRGITDPNPGALPIRLEVQAICQDEALTATPDAAFVNRTDADPLISVRAARADDGNGRVYQIDFTAANAAGRACQGSVLTVVPLSQGDDPETAEDPIRFDSTDGSPAACRPANLPLGPDVPIFGPDIHRVHLPIITRGQ